MENELYTWATVQGSQEMVGQLGHGDTAMYKAPKRVDTFEGVGIKQVLHISRLYRVQHMLQFPFFNFRQLQLTTFLVGLASCRLSQLF